MTPAVYAIREKRNPQSNSGSCDWAGYARSVPEYGKSDAPPSRTHLHRCGLTLFRVAAQADVFFLPKIKILSFRA